MPLTIFQLGCVSFKPPLCLNSLDSHISKSRAKIDLQTIALKRSECVGRDALRMAKSRLNKKVFITPEKPSAEEMCWAEDEKGGNRSLRLKPRGTNLILNLNLVKTR